MQTQNVDSAAVRELVLFATNEAALYERQALPTIANLARFARKGRYDRELAVKGWAYLADAAAREYTRQHGTGEGVGIFTKPTREAAAVEFEDYYREAVRDAATSGALLRVVLTNRGTDTNGNPIARHSVLLDGVLIHEQRARSQIGYGADRSEWANYYVHKTFGAIWQHVETIGYLPAGNKHFDHPQGLDQMELIYKPAAL